MATKTSSSSFLKTSASTSSASRSKKTAARSTTQKPSTSKPRSSALPEKEHAKLSPSGFKQRELCPSYQPTPGDSNASIIGTKLHDLMERLGADVAEHPEFAFLESDEQAQYLEMVAEYVSPFMQNAGDKRTYKELKLDLGPWQIHDCDFGTADLILDFGDTVELMDYKFGKVEVDDAADNIQVWIYVLGVFHKFPKARSVRAHILQPPCDLVSVHTFTRDIINHLLLRARTIADRVRELAGKEHNPSVEACTWCAAKATCPKVAALVLKTGKVAKIEVPELETLKPDELTDPAFLLEHGDMVYNLAKLMEAWGESMRYHMTGFAIAGHEVKGMRLFTKSGKTTIVDVGGTLDQLAMKGYDREEVIADCADLSISKIDKFIGARTQRGGKDEAIQAFRREIAGQGFTTQGPPSSYLVKLK